MSFTDTLATVGKAVGKQAGGYVKRLGEELGAGSQQRLDNARKATTGDKPPIFKPKAVGKKKSSTDSASPDSFKRGGKVRKTGIAKIHKGERVLTKAQAKRYRKGAGK